MRDLQERRALVPALSTRGRQGVVPLVAVVVIVADQISKSIALGHLKLGVPVHVIGPVYWLLTLNKGAAFSMGTGVAPIVEAAVVVLIVGLLLFTRKARRAASIPVAVGLGLLLGGALSNLGDRVFRDFNGSVVDFIQGVSWWPIFNVADSSVVIGVIVLLLTWRSGD